MSAGLGINTIMGGAKESTYRTAVAPTDRLLLLSEGIEFDYQEVLHEYLHGGAALPGQQRAFEPVTGSVELAMAYDQKNSSAFVGSDLPLAVAMGATTWASGSGSNQITFQDALAKFMSLAWNKWDSSDPWEAVSTYINSLTLACAAGENMKMSLDVQAFDLKIGSTATATVANLNALPDDLPQLILFNHFVFRLGNQSGVLTSSDEVGISSFSINVNNNLSDATQTTDDNSSGFDAKKPIQPVRNGFREVTLEVTLPRYDADTFLDHISNEDNLQATLNATDPTNSHEFDAIFPNMKLEKVSAPVAGAEAIEQTLSFKCFKQDPNQTYKPLFSDNSTEASGEVNFETDNERTATIL